MILCWVTKEIILNNPFKKLTHKYPIFFGGGPL